MQETTLLSSKEISYEFDVLRIMITIMMYSSE
jgi:hypothetical protein